ncbi:hypothetical protein GCM10023238_29300 [Streptomyces heliomycini]
MKAALVGMDGELLHRSRRPPAANRAPGRGRRGHPRLRGRTARPRRTAVRRARLAAGVAVPASSTRHRASAVYAANLGWRDVPLRALLAERLGGVPRRPRPRRAHRRSRRGPHRAGRGADRFLFVALGTGIAGAIGIDGRVEAGAHGFAGEIGHVVVRPGGAPCPCGQRAVWSGTRPPRR